MKSLRYTLLIIGGLLLSGLNYAQTFSPERTGGVYYAYPIADDATVGYGPTDMKPLSIPDGYEVFYISHYGRHGSRWLPDRGRYDWVMAHFDDPKQLTKTGKALKKKLDRIVKNARGNEGLLTPLGEQQQRGIARRMLTQFGSAFIGNDSRILARSSTVKRCRQSMLAFCDVVRQTYPNLLFDTETDARYMGYINYESAELKALSKRTKRLPDIDTNRFFGQFFKDVASVKEPHRLLYELHTIASDMQDIPLDIDLWPYFTKAEMLAVHDANDERMTIVNSDTLPNGGIAARSSIPLWENIVTEADEIMKNGAHGASLRFGHDTALYRLLTLMGLTRPGDQMESILPMAANLQLVFVRNATKPVLVAVMLNEQQVSAFEPWQQMKERMARRIHDLEHLRQLTALNTMVGTAPANTRTAGLFGKGSEEHGQTLPAVLVPNGQTFWTPQTRDTEKKCVAPYYYTDTLFQGIRASHWLVGGCTQDYGSFTVAAISGTLRQQPSERATHFSHADEVSHPYYYKVYLPDERLTIELTALSHSAVMRVTPQTDGPLHIIVNTNSDEREGGISLDRDHRLIYAFNPVHRIYQGWGERAGFSGHLLLKYSDEIEDFSNFEQGVSLTFNGRSGHAVELRMSTSFTCREGAALNMEQQLSFDAMAQQNIALWTKRLHTIDVEDADTALVNQFYGALYRASFLPREMSDKDGSYPRFAEGSKMSGRGEKCYGDFSMWDTYRALHPLYNIIVPKTSGDMMQSLVTMYEEGGWLPIFPCWNSYTAAMIGDHCTSVLADAYLKGIRGFDALKAYEGIRRNAMESPKTIDEYKNGMGRRALSSYLKYGYIPLEDSVMEAYHTKEQTSRTLEYAYDDFCAAQLARALGYTDDYQRLMQRSENWRNVINPRSGYADGRHADGRWEDNTDIIHRKPYITEGATCHYTWYVPHHIDGLIEVMGGKSAFSSKLDSMFTSGRYWHGNEPCHQVPWLFSMAGEPEKTRRWVRHILDTEYNDTPGGLSGNDDAGQMSAWQIFAMMGFYPVCPSTTAYVLAGPVFSRVTINQENGSSFTIKNDSDAPTGTVWLNGRQLEEMKIDHSDITRGGQLIYK